MFLIILLTISIYFLMGMFIQERQDNQLQQELQELIQEKEDEPGENSSGDSFYRSRCWNIGIA